MTSLSPDLAGTTPAAVGVILARSSDGWIGRDGTMPWRSPEDLAYFKESTWGHPVIIGWRTWESIPRRFRPFPGRTTIVLTRSPQRASEAEEAGALSARDLNAALGLARAAEGGDLVWIAGGGTVYTQALEAGLIDLALVTVLDVVVPDGDTAAPALGPAFRLASATPSPVSFHPSPTGPAHRFEVWERTTDSATTREAPHA